MFLIISPESVIIEGSIFTVLFSFTMTFSFSKLPRINQLFFLVVYRTLTVFDFFSPFSGEWREEIKHGQGAIYNKKEKLVYTGQFREGKRHGKGKQYREDGTLYYDGLWRNNKKHGEGSLFAKNGEQVFTGNFRDGRRVDI